MPIVDLNISKSMFVPLYFPYLLDYTYRDNVYYGGRIKTCLRKNKVHNVETFNQGIEGKANNTFDAQAN